MNVFDLHAFAAMAVQHQLIEIQVLGLGKVDIVRTGDVGSGARGRALIGFEGEVVLQRGVAASGLGVQPPGVGVGGIGQGQLSTQGPIRPPARQPAAYGDRPEWVQSIGHVPKHRASPTPPPSITVPNTA